MTNENAARRLAATVKDKEHLITIALESYARHMTEAAQEARGQWQLGVDDSEIKAAQDRTLITNNGFRQAMEIFTSCAENALKLRDELCELIDEWSETEE